MLVIADSPPTRAGLPPISCPSWHDPLAAAILVSPDAALIEAVAAQLNTQSATLPRASIAGRRSRTAALVRVDTLDDAVCNDIAPEHLELAVADPEALLARVRNAGRYSRGISARAAGRYFAGPNHVLPVGHRAFFAVVGRRFRQALLGHRLQLEALRSVSAT